MFDGKNNINKNLIIGIVLVLIILVLVVAYPVFFRNSVTTDLAGNVVENPDEFFEEARRTSALSTDDTSPADSADQEDDTSSSLDKDITIQADDEEPETISTPEILVLVTNGVKHTVPLEKILGGGPPKDGIPSIDNPKFESIASADTWLSDEDAGIAVSFNGVSRFYSFLILNWHEIVNDTVGGQAILISFCPLCGTGIVFEPIIKGKVTEFGTSGKLYQSNLVMYDRQTNSYWSQVLGEAIVGELAGERLTLLPSEILLWPDWKAQNPNGLVLNRDTGYFRDYTRSPYGDYETNSAIFFPVDNSDSRYHLKEPTYGLEVNGEFKAYTIEELDQGEATFTDTLAGITYQVEYDKSDHTAKFINSTTDKEIVPVYGFWFSWISVHPDTAVYTAG